MAEDGAQRRPQAVCVPQARLDPIEVNPAVHERIADRITAMMAGALCQVMCAIRSPVGARHRSQAPRQTSGS
jgi:hypothetical protein